MLPSAFVVLDRLPLTPNGKLDRNALVTHRAPAPEHGVGSAPRSQLELHLAKIWENLLQLESVCVRDDFFELGGHSLLAAQLFDQVEKTFGRKLPLDTLWFHARTIEELAAVLREGNEPHAWPQLVPLKPSGARVPLFCIHTIGGNLFHYYELATRLHPDQPVYGVQAAGVYGDRWPDRQMADIAADCIQTMLARQQQAPYLIAGYSSGGVVAFEMAHQLRAQGKQVALLALLDSFAPAKPTAANSLSRLPDLWHAARRHEVRERLYHLVLHGLHLDRLRNLPGVGAAHRWAHWSYSPAAYPGVVDLFLAEQSERLASDPILGWRTLAGELHIHRLPGAHGFIMKRPVVESLAEQLQACIDHALVRRGGVSPVPLA
jgi:thioesterase domain-containing protein/acyl carrier protein